MKVWNSEKEAVPRWAASVWRERRAIHVSFFGSGEPVVVVAREERCTGAVEVGG